MLLLNPVKRYESTSLTQNAPDIFLVPLNLCGIQSTLQFTVYSLPSFLALVCE